MHSIVSSYPDEEKRDTFMHRTEHSILPDKTTASKKVVRSSYGQNSIVRNDKSILFLYYVLYHIACQHPDFNSSQAAVKNAIVIVFFLTNNLFGAIAEVEK